MKAGFFQSLNDIVAAIVSKLNEGPLAEFICTVDQIKDDQARVGSHRYPSATNKS